MTNHASLLDLIDENGSEFDDESPLIFQQSNYYDNETAIEFFKDKNNTFSILSLNCQSLNSKINQLKLYLNLFYPFQFSAICLQETWLTSDAETSLLQIDGYSLITKGRSCSAHGGVAIYLLNTLSYKILNVEFNSDIFDCQFIEIPIENRHTSKKLVISNIYRPPRENIENYKSFIDDINRILNNFQKRGCEMVVTGDFNIDLLKIRTKPIVNDFFETFLSNGFIPKISLPTRITERSAKLIDNIFIKLSENFSQSDAGILYQNISDHQPYFVTLDFLNISPAPPKFIKVNSKSQTALENFIIKLREECNLNQFDLSPESDPNCNYNKLHNVILTNMNKYLPSKLVRFHKHKHKKTKWITNGLLHSIKFRDKLFKKLMMAPPNSQQHFTLKTNINTYNRILKKSIRSAKKSYYESCFHNFRKDIKNTWITIKGILNRCDNNKSFPKHFLINNRYVSDPKSITNEFNKYYIEIGPKLASTIDPPSNRNYSDYLHSPSLNEFKFHNVDENTISKVIDSFKPKTSSGIDGISTKFLKYIKTAIVQPLTLIINQMFTTGVFPDKLKHAKVIPLYKKDDNFLIKNYRPVSLYLLFLKWQRG